jgi:chromosome partitioning protein
VTALSSGLGWPALAEGTARALGWPAARDASASFDPGGPGAEADRPAPSPPTTPMDPDELPMAAAVREDLAAAVSRETDRASAPPTAPAPVTVSRETDPDEPGLADVDAVPNPVNAAVAAAAARRMPWPRPARQRVFGVANQKGGVGKTTSTVNLAAALSQHGARVLVVDLDPQGNASTAFGVDHRAGTPSIYETLVEGQPLHEAAVAVDALPGLWCVPATIDLAGAEIELVSIVARESRLSRALDALPEPYDFVFVDCPPSLGLLTVNALVAAKEVLIPIQCEFYALEGLSQLLRNIELVRVHLNPALHVSTILLTMYDGRTRLAEQVAQEVRTHFGELVLGATIPRSVRISEAPGYGQSVMTYDPASRGAIAYIDAAREIAERSAAELAGSPTTDPAEERSAE